MLLVPRQLRRVGMTGAVPYYGGRLSPAQAYAASHPTAPPPTFADPMTSGAVVRGAVPAPSQLTVAGSATQTPPDPQLAPRPDPRLCRHPASRPEPARRRKPQPTPSWHCSNSWMRE